MHGEKVSYYEIRVRLDDPVKYIGSWIRSSIDDEGWYFSPGVCNILTEDMMKKLLTVLEECR